MNTRLVINLRDGIIEAEGEENFVSTQIEKFLPLFESTLNKRASKESEETIAELDIERDSPTSSSAKKRKRGANPPQGTSCRARILELKKDGFFSAHRSPSDIVAGLKAKGWTHASNQVGAALTRMFAKSEIQRTGADGTFKYYWDRG